MAPRNRSLPPHNEEIEKAFLSCVIQNPKEILMKCIDSINSAYFFIASHKVMFKCIVDMYRNDEEINLISITASLHEAEQLDKVGGAAIITEIATYVPTAVNYDYWQEELTRYFALRKIYNAADQAKDLVFTNDARPQEIVSTFDQKLNAIKKIYYSSEVAQPISSFVAEYIEYMEDNYNHPGKLRGLSYGVQELDNITNGIKPGELIVIGARTSIGKTALMLNIACNMAFDQQIPFGFFSLEMPENQILTRVASYLSGVSLHSISTGFLSKGDLQQIAKATDAICREKIYLDCSGRMTSANVRARSIAMLHKYQIKCIFVDYVQLLKSSDGKHTDYQRVSEVSKDLKQLALELNIPVVTAAQLNRGAESGENSIPRLSHLRNSGDIEQDADVVMLLHRNRENDPEKTKLYVSKNRNGPTGEVDLKFNGETFRFSEATEAAF